MVLVVFTLFHMIYVCVRLTLMSTTYANVGTVFTFNLDGRVEEYYSFVWKKIFLVRRMSGSCILKILTDGKRDIFNL